MVQYRIGTTSDLDTLYESYALEFPESERKTKLQLKQLMTRGAYILMIAEDPIISEDKVTRRVGFSFLYVPENDDFIWLDYLVIERPYQNKGYGSLFFYEMINRWSERKGMFIEIEIPSGEDIDQERRIAYYERLGARKLPIKYHLPTEVDAMEMFLYFKPQSERVELTPEDIKRAIVSSNKTIHWDHADLESVWHKNVMFTK